MNKRGFTLLEVLVALAVLAIAMGALLRVASNSSATFTQLRDRTLAGWVAENALARFRLAQRWPSDGSRFNGRSQMAGRTWHWTITVASTPDPDLRRLTIAVRSTGSDLPNPLLSAFLGRLR